MRERADAGALNESLTAGGGREALPSSLRRNQRHALFCWCGERMEVLRVWVSSERITRRDREPENFPSDCYYRNVKRAKDNGRIEQMGYCATGNRDSILNV